MYHIFTARYVTISCLLLCHTGANNLLQQDGSMLNKAARNSVLPAGRLDIRRLVDANIEEPSAKDIQCKL